MNPALSHIRLTNFRNYSFYDITFNKPLTIIHGFNGAGKTNLLEAISLLTPGKGLRGASLEELSNNKNGEWSVISEINGYKITTGIEKGFSKRIVKIDDEKQKGTNILAEYVSAVWLTPQMDGIFIEGSPGRRVFFDRLIYNFDPEHASRVAVYENAMRERLRLLKSGHADNTWLKVLERRMAEYGVAVAAARNEVIAYLQQSLAEATTSFPRPEIMILGIYENMLHEKSALEVEQIFSSNLLESRIADLESGRTTTGVHRTDFAVTNTMKNMPAELCSTGEQKALLLSIILGLARLLKNRKHKTPIILLDEVIAHLDESRRTELFNEIISLGCQCFMTGTEKELFAPIFGLAQLIEIPATQSTVLQAKIS